jgi:hypothetical protein
MKAANTYVDLDGNVIPLGELDAEERRLVACLRRRARSHPDWCAFGTYYMRTLPEFYDARGLSRKELVRTPLWQIAQDLSSRLGIAAGLIRAPDERDYRGQLERLILERFPSRRAFCKATGLSPDMLSHVLAGRKDLSLPALEQALARIGYVLKMTPAAEQRTG